MESFWYTLLLLIYFWSEFVNGRAGGILQSKKRA